MAERDDTLEILQKALTAVTGGALLRDANGEIIHNSLRFEARQLLDQFGDDVDGVERELPGDQRIAIRRRVLADGTTIIWTDTVTELRRAEEELFRLYHTDELTGLDNWKAIERTGATALGLYHRYKRPLSVLRMDIVEPTDIDEMENRDQIIKHVGKVIGHGVRLVDHVARMSGNRFLALMPETDEAGARQSAARLVERVARSSVQHLGSKSAVAIEVGIASPDEAVETFEALVEKASLNLERRKNGPKLSLVSGQEP